MHLKHIENMVRADFSEIEWLTDVSNEVVYDIKMLDNYFLSNGHFSDECKTDAKKMKKWMKKWKLNTVRYKRDDIFNFLGIREEYEQEKEDLKNGKINK